MDIIERLVEILVVLVAAKLGGEVFLRLRQPAVIGELIAGMIVGASVLGWVEVTEGGVVATLAEIGVILLLFDVGLEIELRDVTRLGLSAVVVALIGVVTPFALGYLAALAMSIGGGSTEVALFVGAAMTATSVGITARVFGELQQLETDEAKTVIGAAVVDDIIGLIILAVVVGLLGDDGGFEVSSLLTISFKALLFLVVASAVGSLALPYYFRFLSWLRIEGSFMVGTFVLAVAVGVLAEELAGLEPIVGAFVAGLMVGQAHHIERIHRELRAVGLLFIPIFFLSVGALVDVPVLFEPKVLAIGAVISLLAAAGKVVSGLGVIGPGVRRSVVGVGMIPRGEVGLIFAAIGADQLRSVVTEEEVAIVVLMVIVTTLVAPVALNSMLRRGTPEPDPGRRPGTGEEE